MDHSCLQIFLLLKISAEKAEEAISEERVEVAAADRQVVERGALHHQASRSHFYERCFCSTSLPLASNRWVRLTFSSLCPLF